MVKWWLKLKSQEIKYFSRKTDWDKFLSFFHRNAEDTAMCFYFNRIIWSVGQKKNCWNTSRWKSGLRGYLWAVLLAGSTVGGLYVAFPIAYSLHTKGAKLSIIFTYIGASAICRVPMTIFEASFMGIKFSIIRLLVSIPLVIVGSMLLGNYLTTRKYKISPGK